MTLGLESAMLDIIFFRVMIKSSASEDEKYSCSPEGRYKYVTTSINMSVTFGNSDCFPEFLRLKS